MPTVEDLQRLQALLKTLEQVGNAQRGELIEAEDWNALVGAVADVARSVLAADAEPVIPPHDHLDQVTQAWLAPQLRELIERGPLADPAAQSRLSSLELALKRLGDRLDASSQRVDDFKGRLTDVATNDLERQAAITRVSRALDSVVDPRPELQAFRGTLAVVQRDLTTVQEAASRLMVNGQLIDVGQVAGKVTELERFRDTFKAANGEMLDAAGIERRIAEVSVRSVTHGDLDSRLENLQLTVSPDQLSAVEGRLSTSLTDRVNSQTAVVRTDILAEVGRRLDGVNDLVATRVSDALPAVTRNVAATLQPNIDAAQRAAVDAALAAAQRTIDARDTALRADFDARLTDLRAGIQASVRVEVSQSLAAQLAPLQNKLSDALGRIDTLSARAGRADELAQAHAAAIAKLTQNTATLENDLRTALLAELDLRLQVVNRGVDEKLTAFSKAQNARLETVTQEIANRAVDEARRVASEAAANATAATRAQLLAEMRSVAREEVGLAIRDQVRGQVTEAVREQFTVIPGLVSQEVRKAVAAGGGRTTIDVVGRGGGVLGGGGPA